MIAVITIAKLTGQEGKSRAR